MQLALAPANTPPGMCCTDNKPCCPTSQDLIWTSLKSIGIDLSDVNRRPIASYWEEVPSNPDNKKCKVVLKAGPDGKNKDVVDLYTLLGIPVFVPKLVVRCPPGKT